MTEKLTLEKNQRYILDNLDKYVVDGQGNFVHIDSDLMGSENAELYFISKAAVSNHEEILEAIEKSILQNKGDWKAFVEDDNTAYYKNIKDERVIYRSAFSFERSYRIIGELGYRKNIWKNYEETIKIWNEREKWFRENITNNNQSTPPTPGSKKPTSPLPNQPDQTPNPPKQPNNPNHQDKNNPSPEKEQEKPTNSPLPPPADIQTHYKTDKAQTEITNNPNLTNNQAKQRAQEFLKLIITAELLIKEAKTNSEILTKLLKEKKQNSSVYQLLNKENRIDQAINQLQNMEKKENSAPTNQNQPSKNSSSFKIIIPIVLSLLAIVGITVLVRRRKKRNKH